MKYIFSVERKTFTSESHWDLYITKNKFVIKIVYSDGDIAEVVYRNANKILCFNKFDENLFDFKNIMNNKAKWCRTNRKIFHIDLDKGYTKSGNIIYHYRNAILLKSLLCDI